MRERQGKRETTHTNTHIYQPDDYFSLMPYLTKLETKNLDCIALPIVLAKGCEYINQVCGCVLFIP